MPIKTILVILVILVIMSLLLILLSHNDSRIGMASLVYCETDNATFEMKFKTTGFLGIKTWIIKRFVDINITYPAVSNFESYHRPITEKSGATTDQLIPVYFNEDETEYEFAK